MMPAKQGPSPSTSGSSKPAGQHQPATKTGRSASGANGQPGGLMPPEQEGAPGSTPRSPSWRRLSAKGPAALNGQAGGKQSDLTGTDSLTVPGTSLLPKEQHHLHVHEDGTSHTRRGSNRSLDSHLSGDVTVDVSRAPAKQPVGQDRLRSTGDQAMSVVTTDDSYLRSAIPSLPLSLAVTCLAVNVCLPGFGTFW